MTERTEGSISTLRGSTEGSFVRKVWNWLQMVVHRLLGESMGRASMKEAMFSRQCSIVPPAGRLFLLFKPYGTEGQTRLSNKLLNGVSLRLLNHWVGINHLAHEKRLTTHTRAARTIS